VGISAIPAGVLFGAVWHYRNAGDAFLFAALLSLLSALLLRFWCFRGRSIPDSSIRKK
jgi:predicted MFS family arabinose efflux permease